MGTRERGEALWALGMRGETAVGTRERGEALWALGRYERRGDGGYVLVSQATPISSGMGVACETRWVPTRERGRDGGGHSGDVIDSGSRDVKIWLLWQPMYGMLH